MSLLLSSLLNALPIMGELTSAAVPHSLEHNLPPLVQETWPFLSSFVAVVVMNHLGLSAVGCVGLFLIVYGVQLAEVSRSKQDLSFARVKVWGAEGQWRGAAPVGCVVGGILLLLVGLLSHQLNVPGF